MLIPEYLHLFKTQPVYEKESSKQPVRNIMKTLYFVSITHADFPTAYYHFDNLLL